MNNYLIESLDFVTVKSLIKKIIKDNGFLDNYINYYDLEEDLLSQVIEDINTYSFLSPKKVIVLKNVGFLEGNNKIKYADDQINSLLKYIDNPSDDILLIICVKKLDTRKNIVKELSKKVKIINNKLTPKTVIDTYLKDYKMDFRTRNLLLEYTDNNISLLTKECQKLSLFKLDDKTITKEDIESIVFKTKKDTDKMLFNLVDFILSRNKEKAFKLYLELLDYDYTEVDVIGRIAGQLRVIYQIMFGYEDKLSNKQIAEVLGIHPYRVEKSSSLVYNFTKEEIVKMMSLLAKLDLDIKSGHKDSKIAFKLFLINL